MRSLRPLAGTPSAAVSGPGDAKAAQNEARKLEGKSSLRTKEATKAEIQAAEAVLAAPGVLRVRVVSATGLAAADSNGLSDPYATVFHRAMPEVVHKTHVMRKTLDPEWNETISLTGTLNEFVGTGLLLKVFDWDSMIKLSKDDPLGDAQVSLDLLQWDWYR